MAGTDDLMLGLHELGEARPLYEAAWAYWKSSVPESFVSPVWRKIQTQTGDRYRMNIAKVPIVALADRLKVTGVVAVGESGDRDEGADKVLQEQVWTACKLPLQSKRLIRNTLIFGDSYWYIWPGDSPDEGAAASRVTIAYNDPRTVRVVYDAHDELTIRFAIKSWEEKGQLRANVLYRDRIERGWVLKPGGKADEQSSWERQSRVDPDTKESIDEDVTNPYDRVPIFHFRNDMPYGSSEGIDMWGAQDAVQKLASTLAYSAERAGLRDRYAITEANATLNGQSPNIPEWDDDADGDEGNRDNSQMRSGPGETQVWEGIKTLGEWSAADPKGFMEPAEWFLRFAALTARVSSRYADPGGQHPSGAALRAADAPEAAKTEDRQEYLDDELKSALAFALKILGVEQPRVDIRWKPPGIVDDVDTWTIAEAKIRAGVPVQVALTETGLYDPDVVSQWLTDSQVEMDLARRVDLLASAGNALGQLSQAVAMGLLDERTARQVADQTMGQLAPDVTTDEPA